MKVVLHSSRGYHNTSSYGTLHNDRNFDCEARNIIKSKTANNIVWLYQNGKKNNEKVYTIEDCEREFYIEKFSPWLKIKNERYRKNGHKERMMTMDTFRSCYRYCPEEIIFQVGTIDDCPPLAEFTFICYAFVSYLQKWAQNHQNAFSIIDWALHQDEIGAPHLHIRRVWHYVDEKSGVLQIGQEKVLERIGYLPPFPSEEQSKYNNRKISYDQETRSWIITFCRSRNLKIDDVPKDKRLVGLDLSDYIIRQKMELKKREEKVLEDNYKLVKSALHLQKERASFLLLVKTFLSNTYKSHLVKLSEKELKNEYETKFNEVVSFILPIYEQDIENNVSDYKTLFTSFPETSKIKNDALNRLLKIEKNKKIIKKDSIFFFNNKDYLSPHLKMRIMRKMEYFEKNTSNYFAIKAIVELNFLKTELLEKKREEKKENYQYM